MNGLVFHELKKLFSKKILLFALLFLLLANAFYIYQNNDAYHDPYNKDFNEAEWAIYKTVEGIMTAEKLNALADYQQKLAADDGSLTEYYSSQFGDLTITNNLLTALTDAYQYQSKMNELLRANAEQLAVYQAKGNEYLAKKAQLVGETYSERSIDSYYKVDSYYQYLNYDFSSFLILLLIFLATSALYAGESEKGMLSLIRSTPNGRLKLSNAKLAAMLLYILTVCVLFFACDFLMFLWCARLCGASNPLYSISNYAYTPLTVTIGGFAAMTAAIKYCGFLLFGLISCLFSSLFQKSYMVFSLDFVLCIGFMLMSEYAGGLVEYVNLINPINLLVCRKMFSSFTVINIFGKPVFQYAVSLLSSAVFACVLYTAVSMLNHTNARARRPRA